MKLQRHAAILKIVRDRPIQSQDELRAVLVQEGIEVAQATLSRDIRELGLAKLTDAQGRSVYTHPQRAAVQPDLGHVLSGFLIGAEGVGPLLVLRTAAGAAGAVARVIDQAAWPEVLGTLAGDDTVLIVTRGQRPREQIAERIREFTE